MKDWAFQLPAPRAFLLALFFVLSGSSPSACPAGEAGVVVELHAGTHDREGCVASVELPTALRTCRELRIVPLDGDRAVPVQVENGAVPRAWWCVGRKVPAGTTRRYRLVPADDKPDEHGGVTVEDDGQRLSVKVFGKPVLAYNQAIVPAPNPAEPYYAKSGHIHPVYTPSGQLITDDFSPDHPHQHGIMFAWRKTTFEGRSTNGWDQKAQLGRVEHVRTVKSGGGPVFGFFNVDLRQVDLTAPGGPRPVLNVALAVRVYSLTDRYVADVDAMHVCAGDAPVTIDKVEYGGFMVRGRADWAHSHEHDYLTSEGKTKLDGNQSRPLWVQLYGPVADRFVGISVLDHPDNFRFPQPSRLAAETPFLCFAPAALGDFSIEPGKPHVSRYRLLVHDGKLDSDTLDRCWQDYAEPPEVRVVSP